MNKTLSNILKFLFFLSLGAGILYMVYKSQNEAFLADCAQRGIAEQDCNLIDKLINDFKSVNFGWLVMVLVAFLISNFNRSMKWLILLRPLGYRPRFINAFLAILVGYFANLGLPRMGEVVRAGIVAKYEKVPAEKVLGTIVVDRVVDLVLMALAFGLVLIFEYDKIAYYLSELSATDKESSGPGLLVILGVLFSVLLILGFVFRKRLMKTALYEKIYKLFFGFYEGLMTVRKLDTPGWFIFHSVSIWVLYFLMTWFGFLSFGPTANLSISAALTVFAFGTLGMVIPSPGGMGTFHAMVIAALTLFYGIQGDDAFSAANIIFFTISIGSNVLMGLLSLLLLPIVNRDYEPTHQ
ncbi:MAG: lysylphosphatidylglycerol synthase transmembrane domain-containing protein [Saprospiraceae bacterium]